MVAYCSSTFENESYRCLYCNCNVEEPTQTWTCPKCNEKVLVMLNDGSPRAIRRKLPEEVKEGESIILRDNVYYVFRVVKHYTKKDTYLCFIEGFGTHRFQKYDFVNCLV